MNALIEKIVLWWADRQMTPEQMAVRGYQRRGLPGTLPTLYRHLFTAPQTTTRALALTGRALAARHRN